MSKLLILCALKEELPPEKNIYKDITFYTGMGKKNTLDKLAEILDNMPVGEIVNYGTAGSCNMSISGLVECGIFFKRNDISQQLQNNPIVINSDKHIIATGDTFVTNKIIGCDLVDMEAYHIAQTCQKYRLKFQCYKYISDYVNSSSQVDWEKNISKGYPLFLEKINDYIKNSI